MVPQMIKVEMIYNSSWTNMFDRWRAENIIILYNIILYSNKSNDGLILDV
jgi:hypothetical protein